MKSVSSILLLIFAPSFVRTDEHERRWNTPPELTPESVVKMLDNGESQTRLLPLIPVTATISLNAGHNNAHSVSLGASLDGISFSESNSYNDAAGHAIDGSSVSVSKSTSVSAGLSGISTADAKAYSDGNNAKTESHSLSFGQATAASFGAVENGRAITGASSSVGISQSSAITGSNRGQSSSQVGIVNTQYPYRPTWNNVGPNNEYNDRRFNRPTLTVSKPRDETRPTLNINADTFRREQKPTIHIYKWRPNHTVYPRPGLSIEHHSSDSWNDRNRGRTGLQVGVSSSSFYGLSNSNSASKVNADPSSFATSSSSQVYTSENAQSQSWGSASSGYDSGDTFGGDNTRGRSTSGHRGGYSVMQVDSQAARNEHVQGIASFTGGSFIKLPEGTNAQSQTIPLQYVRSKDPKQEQSDSDIISDLAHTVGELFDIV